MSPMRSVPPHIMRPSYADGGRPTEKELEPVSKHPMKYSRMRKAGRTARTVLNEVLHAVRPGMTTEELDVIAHEKRSHSAPIRVL